MRTLLLALLAALAGPAMAEDTAPALTLALSPFSALEVDTEMSLSVVCGADDRLDAYADLALVPERYLGVAQAEGVLRLHFRRDFDRHVHPDEVRLELTVAGPIGRLTATTGARVALPPCALASDRFVLRAETGARVELEGRTLSAEVTLSSGASLNALSGGRAFFAESVRLAAGPRTRAGLCGARAVEVTERAGDALLLTGC